ncbi:MAG: hypothetical protein HYS44_03520 [Candidatus Niyogibacteria bacterium]|nr:hypothetical protein [Candidatus Niyogibacteria bacterium]
MKTKFPAKHVGRGPPMLADFSEAAIARSVHKAIFLSPAATYPLMIGGIGFAALLAPWLVAGFAFPLIMVSSAAVVVGAASWVWNFGLRRDVFETRYIREFKERLARQSKEALAELHERLQECRSVEGGEAIAEQALAQLGLIQGKFDAFQNMLKQKLDAGELTFGRFLATALQVYASVMNNLRSIADHLQSAGSIKIEYARKRMRELEKITAMSQNDSDEIATLKERIALYEAQIAKADGLLTENEKTMTAVDKSIAAVAEMQTDPKAGDLEFARSDLEELVRRASHSNG